MDPRIARLILEEDERKRLQEDGYRTYEWKDYCERQETKTQDNYNKHGA